MSLNLCNLTHLSGVTRPDRRCQPIFYVYVYWIDDIPFYVGKGHGSRCREHLLPRERQANNTLMQRKMAKLVREGRRDDIKITKFIEDVDEETAFQFEGFLIRALGRRCDRDGPLCNLTWEETSRIQAMCITRRDVKRFGLLILPSGEIKRHVIRC